MQLTIDIPEKDLVEFGRDIIHQEIQQMLKWLKIKQSFKKISGGLQGIDDRLYTDELEKIRESAWLDYKNVLKY